ncbi:hypothetical protein OJ996_25005 [Luteolibacter sp. GHJ8]|uniref:Uncharacterized protein n=1 Tax=Luteolibacter rhizosphaerae TaxID=2989719 RepID=A0ABT3GAK2_9BACT|nr:hypothetical protein [Luteolibacter rhizosphaerae]MCW1916872.1 hypothetical protein [Luteolibacter rhizosphaerae]
MSSIEEIGAAIERLSPEELSAFRRWFSAYDAARWDSGIEMDVVGGKLGPLAGEALDCYRSGTAREL